MNLHLKPETSCLAQRVRNSRFVRGQAFLVLTMCLVLLCGFVGLAIDLGMMSLRANQLQKACDAAALTAAADVFLNPSLNSSPTYSSATAKAQTLGTLNRATISDVTFNSVTSSSSTVTVTGTAIQTFFFAPVIGFKSSTLIRRAKATYGMLTGISGGVPLGMTVEDYNSYLGGAPFTLSLVRNDKSAFSIGNVIALSLQTGSNGKSPSKWEDDLASGSSLVTNIGQSFDLNSLNASLQTEQSRLLNGLAARVNTALATFAIFILDTATETPGTSSHPILGIAIVTLQSVDGNGNITLQIPNTVGRQSGGIYGGATPGVTNASSKVYLVP